MCRRISWHSPDGVTKKIYDFILCSSWLRPYATNCRVYNSFDFNSNHKLVIANLSTPTSKKAMFIKRNKFARRDKIDFESTMPRTI